MNRTAVNSTQESLFLLQIYSQVIILNTPPSPNKTSKWPALVMNSFSSAWLSVDVFLFTEVIISFIRLEDYDKEAAKVDVTECTQDLQRYEDPDNANIEYWDLPGIGTPNFPAKTYFEDVKLNEYDTFVTFIDTRLRENDLELARKITSLGKKYFFVRSKIDQDVQNAERSSRPESFNEPAVLGKIRSECLKKLGDLQSKKENIFLISCHVREKWEFSLLRQANLYALEQNQRDAMIRLLEKASKEAVEKKVKVIGGDIWKTSAWSGAAALVPVASMVVDDWLIKEEFKRYKTELGIPEEESDEFEKLDPTSKAKVSVALNLLTKILPNSLTAALSSEVGIKQAFSFLPTALLILGPLSGGYTYKILDNILKNMADTAFAILEGVVTEKKIASTANVFTTSVSLNPQHS